MARRIPKDAMTRALAAAGNDEERPGDVAPTAQELPEAGTADDAAGDDAAADDDAADDAADDDAADDAAEDDPAEDDPAEDDAAGDDAAGDDAAEDDAAEDDAAEDDADSPDVPDKLYFRIGEVAALVGVDAHVLRYWESEFRMKPHRSSSGQRLYRKQDLSRFFRIKRLLHDEGYTIAGARKVLAGTGGQAPQVDVPRIREALDHVQALRDRILELRDEMDPEGRA